MGKRGEYIYIRYREAIALYFILGVNTWQLLPCNEKPLRFPGLYSSRWVQGSSLIGVQAGASAVAPKHYRAQTAGGPMVEQGSTPSMGASQWVPVPRSWNWGVPGSQYFVHI